MTHRTLNIKLERKVNWNFTTQWWNQWYYTVVWHDLFQRKNKTYIIWQYISQNCKMLHTCKHNKQQKHLSFKTEVTEIKFLKSMQEYSLLDQKRNENSLVLKVYSLYKKIKGTKRRWCKHLEDAYNWLPRQPWNIIQLLGEWTFANQGEDGFRIVN